MPTKIKEIKAKKILDSRGNPTLEVEVKTKKGKFKASVPAGASTGKLEAIAVKNELAISNVNNIIYPELKGKNILDQQVIDDLMIKLDGSSNKSKLGANAILGVSLAVARAAANSSNLPLWKYISLIAKTTSFLSIPTYNIINGGAHAKGKLALQEFMVVVKKDSPAKNLAISLAIYKKLKEIIKNKYGRSAVNLGDEGGFAPPIDTAKEAIELILEAAALAGYPDKVNIAIDAAASQFYKEEKYFLSEKPLSSQELLEYYLELKKIYPIISLEDPFFEEDWQSFASLKERIGEKMIIVGDDLLVTNQNRIKEAEERKACNGLILKVNQIGTLSEAITAGKTAKSFNWKVIVSHRSGETKDSFIADLAVGLGADYLKAGAPATKYRLAKYNRLLKIEKEI
jgi:enolase